MKRLFRKVSGKGGPEGATDITADAAAAAAADPVPPAFLPQRPLVSNGR